ncbi:unnamed protein product [Ixodes pacificus]
MGISNRLHLYIIQKTSSNLTICDGAKKIRFTFCHFTRVTLRATATLLAHSAALFATPAHRSPSRGRAKNRRSGDSGGGGGWDTGLWCCCYRMPLVVVFVHHAALTKKGQHSKIRIVVFCMKKKKSTRLFY